MLECTNNPAEASEQTNQNVKVSKRSHASLSRIQLSTVRASDDIRKHSFDGDRLRAKDPFNDSCHTLLKFTRLKETHAA